MLAKSSTTGHAMKGTDRNKMLSAVVGKALEPLRLFSTLQLNSDLNANYRSGFQVQTRLSSRTFRSPAQMKKSDPPDEVCCDTKLPDEHSAERR
jgi:hypothetical protein